MLGGLRKNLHGQSHMDGMPVRSRNDPHVREPGLLRIVWSRNANLLGKPYVGDGRLPERLLINLCAAEEDQIAPCDR